MVDGKRLFSNVFVMVILTTCFAGCEKHTWPERFAMRMAIDDMKKQKGWGQCFVADIKMDSALPDSESFVVLLVKSETKRGERRTVYVSDRKVIGYGDGSEFD